MIFCHRHFLRQSRESGADKFATAFVAAIRVKRGGILHLVAVADLPPVFSPPFFGPPKKSPPRLSVEFYILTRNAVGGEVFASEPLRTDEGRYVTDAQPFRFVALSTEGCIRRVQQRPHRRASGGRLLPVAPSTSACGYAAKLSGCLLCSAQPFRFVAPSTDGCVRRVQQ